MNYSSRWVRLVLITLTCLSISVAGNCDRDKFECANGRCIPQNWMCDREYDCGHNDLSDESNCDAVPCAESEFDCGSDCIPRRWFCDGQIDCQNGADEDESCAERTCPPAYFQCAETCIPLAWVCDDDRDCANGEDEASCTRKDITTEATSTETTPAGATSVDTTSVDTTSAATSAASTSTIATTLTTTTRTTITTSAARRELECGSEQQCIPLQWKCDDPSECSYGETEEGCVQIAVRFPVTTTHASSIRNDTMKVMMLVEWEDSMKARLVVPLSSCFIKLSGDTP